MNHINKVILLGVVNTEPTLGNTNSGCPVCNMGLEINFSKENGDALDESTFVHVDAWGKLAERAAELKKGQHVFVEGRLRLSKWTHRETGELRARICITAERLAPIMAESEVDCMDGTGSEWADSKY